MAQGEPARYMAMVMDASQPKPGGGSWFGPENIFTIAVGPQQQMFIVHECYLMKSPVFACMCTGNFAEAHKRHIVLPEDDPVHFAAIVDFLYTGHIWSTGVPLEEEPSNQDIVIELAHLYIMADKYALHAMKSRIVSSMKTYTNPDNPSEWLAIAEIIYSSVPTVDGLYPMYLNLLLTDHLNSVHGKGPYGFGISSLLKEYIEKGGRLAVDISQSLLLFGLEAGIKLPQQEGTEQDRFRKDCWSLLED
ncbi:MAG: hypothetical protein Q9222_000321 [Ikaeria aurantiellina]